MVSEYYDNVHDYTNANMVNVSAGATVGDINAQLERPGTITGRVIDPNGAPVNGAAVSANSNSGWGNTTTDADGRYTVGDLGAGDYRIEVRAPAGINLATEYYNNATSYDTATPVTVTAGANTAGIDVQLAVGGTTV